MAEKKGYRKLAAFMGPNRELAIFRKFNSLNMLRIMSLQAELIELEHQYHQACNEDDAAEENSDRGLYTRSFHHLFSSSNPQKSLLEKINTKVNEYSKHREILFSYRSMLRYRRQCLGANRICGEPLHHTHRPIARQPSILAASGKRQEWLPALSRDSHLGQEIFR
jgi:hypothetical protein